MMAEQSLEERLQRLEKMVQKALDVQEIANLMGKQVYMHEAQLDPTFADTLFAQKSPDISWEVANFGRFEGKEEIQHVLNAHGSEPGDDSMPVAGVPGCLTEHTLCSPVIEVAGDGKTAKGVWMSPGHETLPDPVTGKLQAYWCWCKYGCDFIKEDGEWKILHYHVYRTFRTLYEKSWVDEESAANEEKFNKMAMEILGKPGSTSYDHPYNTKDFFPELVPAPPEPHETYDETTRY